MKFFASLILFAGATMAIPPPVNTPRKGLALVGDGNPHQAYFYKQVTDGITCAEGDKSTCTTSHMKSKTFTIGFNGNVDPGVWISGGFTVSESITTGESSGCNGGPDDTVCVWWRTAFTAYTVQWHKYFEGYNTPATGEPIGDPFVVWSPNADNLGSNYVCAVNNECDHIGVEWWGKSQPIGGPQKYPFGGKRWQ